MYIGATAAQCHDLVNILLAAVKQQLQLNDCTRPYLVTSLADLQQQLQLSLAPRITGAQR
jgi:hypothetical protein